MDSDTYHVNSEPFLNRSRTCSMSMKLPYIMAEAGVNHEGNLDTAKRLIEEAGEGGANAIKFQTYKASTLASQHTPPHIGTRVKTAQLVNSSYSVNLISSRKK